METVTKIMSIAAGGALGAVVRHLVGLSPVSKVFDRFPLPTFLINVVGSFLIGFLIIFLTDKIQVSDNLRMAIMVGFIGAFTTFATFEMEIYGLLRERIFSTALLYLVLSIVSGFIALLAGVAAARRF
jgi:CrcB protein